MTPKHEKNTVKEVVEINKELDDQFRKTIAETKGLRKGVLKESFEEALVAWIKEQKKSRATQSK